MEAAAKEHELTAARVAPGAGAMLREAREAAGLSCVDVAGRTRLESRVVEALEREDYGSLAAAAFVKGYIRSIARELNVDPAPILAQYTQQTHEEDPALADFSSRSPVQITSTSPLIRTISIALALAVVVLVALWWQRNYREIPRNDAALAQLAAANDGVRVDPGVPLPYSWTVVEHSSKPLEPVNSWRHQTDGSAPPALTPAVPAAVPADPDAGDTSMPAATPGEPVAPDATVTATGELVLIGNGESWLEVSDVAGKRLYFGMLKSGQRIGLTGTPPYDLVIGNAPAVAVMFRGGEVDVRSHAVNGVARFSLGDPR
jgi:cytoskeleton protein RodZ